MSHASLLVLSHNDAWNAALRKEAAGLAVAVTAASSAGQAVTLLAGNTPGFSHFLLDADAAETVLAVLVRLAAETAPGTPRLILRDTGDLGEALRHLTRDATRAGTEAGWLAHAIATSTIATGTPRPLGAAEIRTLLHADSLQLRYQPIVGLDSRRPVGIEALARLEHPVRGNLQPADFVPQLEAAGHGWQLTRRAIDIAFADWGDLRLEALDLTLSLNLPLDVLLDPDLTAMLVGQCDQAGVPRTRLLLELTETQIVVDPDRLLGPMQALVASGIRIALDDITPVTHEPDALLGLPFAVMKLDKNVVCAAAESGTSRDFIKRNIAKGHAAGMRIVAEGVEDATLWAQMRALGADAAQGFHIARPLPAEAVPLWHRDWVGRS